jgi:hypothetical protein
MALFPLYSRVSQGTRSLTFQEGLERGFPVFFETEAEGSITEFKMVNSANLPILVLDGEELERVKCSSLPTRRKYGRISMILPRN